MNKKEKKICQRCGCEFEPLGGFCTLCVSCYRKSQKMLRRKVLRTKNLTIIDKDINNIQQKARGLTEEEKAQIAHMLGKFTEISDIQKYYETKNKDISYQSIKGIRDSQKWQIYIHKEREKWLSQIKEVPIANKRVRIEAWQDMMLEGFETKKMTTVKNALEGARNEMEGVHQHTVGGDNYSLTYIADMSNNDLLKRRDEIMDKIKRLTKNAEISHKKNRELETEFAEVIDENNQQSIER